MNERKRHSESFNEVLRIQRSLLSRTDASVAWKDTPSIAAPERRIMGSSWALLKTDAAPCVSIVRFVLFNDALLIATPERKKTGLCCEHIVPLNTCEAFTHCGLDRAHPR